MVTQVLLIWLFAGSDRRKRTERERKIVLIAAKNDPNSPAQNLDSRKEISSQESHFSYPPRFFVFNMARLHQNVPTTIHNRRYRSSHLLFRPRTR
jgi:hypothetical protein